MLPGEGKGVHMSFGNEECDYKKKVLHTSIISVSKDYFNEFKLLVQIVYLSQTIWVLNRMNLSHDGLCPIIHSTTIYWVPAMCWMDGQPKSCLTLPAFEWVIVHRWGTYISKVADINYFFPLNCKTKKCDFSVYQ